jgi:SAM-dependent methyltransferase
MNAQALENIKTFEGWASDYYEPQAIRHYDQAIARMLRVLDPPPGSEVLDAGCGTGVHSVRVARAGFRVHAIDISHVALDDARQRAEREGLADRIRFDRADLTQLPFDDGHFQTIFSWGVVIHIPQIEVALKELVRVLRPGGRLALQVTNGSAVDCSIENLARRALRKPRPGAQRTDFGVGAWDDGPVGKLWTVFADVPTVTRHMKSLGCRRVARMSSEFTEMQRRVNGLPRLMLRHLNTAWFALRLPAWPACTNILVFEKQGVRAPSPER